MLEIQDFKNAKAQTLDGVIIDVDILHPVHGWIPYTIDPTDTGTTICNDTLIGLIGDDYKEFTLQDHHDKLAQDARLERSFLLKNVDKVVSNPLRWNEFTDQKKVRYLQYKYG